MKNEITFLFVLCTLSPLQMLHHHYQGRCGHIADDGTDTSPDPPTDAEGKIIPYFEKTEPALEALKKIVLDSNWIQSFQDLGKSITFNSPV